MTEKRSSSSTNDLQKGNATLILKENYKGISSSAGASVVYTREEVNRMFRAYIHKGTPGRG